MLINCIIKPFLQGGSLCTCCCERSEQQQVGYWDQICKFWTLIFSSFSCKIDAQAGETRKMMSG